MRHTYRCQLRWGDMDQLGHVNNVAYLDYLQEARVDLLRATGVRAEVGADGAAQAVVVVRHRVTFVAPLVYAREPVAVDVWVSDLRAATATLSYEVHTTAPDGSRRTHLRAASVLAPYDLASGAPRRLSAAQREALARYAGRSGPSRGVPAGEALPALPPGVGDDLVLPLHPRFSDVDGYGHVNNVATTFWFEEARIAFMDTVWCRDPADDRSEGAVVLGQLDVDYREPAFARAEPYELRSGVSRLGASSFSIDSEAGDPRAGGRAVARARATLVCFDLATQRAAPMPARYREGLSSKVFTMN